ncbi:carbohydrate kinase family protein, partial [Candidatus Uhrbacteria bacterium]|nr:carbohydrate kinase family protein [Candidatus Uhrbacteria bacterium]
MVAHGSKKVYNGVMLFDVITAGAATQDVFLRSSSFEQKRDPTAPDGFEACVPLGAKIALDDMVFSTGGGATNAATTFARYGLKTACIARVGHDAAGAQVHATLTEEGISTVGLQIDSKIQTAYSVIMLAGSGHRSIMTYRGAAKKIHPDEIPWKDLKTRWYYMTSVGGNVELLSRLFVHAEKGKAKIAWNPGNDELKLGLKKLEPFLVRTSVLILNREEAAILSNAPPRHLETILSILSRYPQQALVITDGQKGAYIEAEGQIFFAPALKANRVNTTGAGDAFGSGFVAALMKGKT